MASKEYTAAQHAPVIRSCHCEHEYQDRKYGAGNRLHTVRPGQGQQGGLVCTVCGTQKGL